VSKRKYSGGILGWGNTASEARENVLSSSLKFGHPFSVAEAKGKEAESNWLNAFEKRKRR